MFSVKEGTKFPIAGGDRAAISCSSGHCAVFGALESVIFGDSNNNAGSFCRPNGASFKFLAG